MESITTLPQTEAFFIEIPKVDINRFKGLMNVMGWTFRKKEENEIDTADSEEWTAEEEREAFLYTSRINASKMCTKYL